MQLWLLQQCAIFTQSVWHHWTCNHQWKCENGSTLQHTWVWLRIFLPWTGNVSGITIIIPHGWTFLHIPCEVCAPRALAHSCSGSMPEALSPAIPNTAQTSLELKYSTEIPVHARVAPRLLSYVFDTQDTRIRLGRWHFTAHDGWQVHEWSVSIAIPTRHWVYFAPLVVVLWGRIHIAASLTHIERETVLEANSVETCVLSNWIENEISRFSSSNPSRRMYGRIKNVILRKERISPPLKWKR